jgi:hypothetical protein
MNILRNRYSLPLTIVIVILTLASSSQATFETLPGIRTVAIGGATVADGGYALGFMVNPASSAWGYSSSIEMGYTKMYLGLENNSFMRNTIGGYSSIGKWGSIGLGTDRFDSDLYGEHRTMISYARMFNNIAVGLGLGFSGHAFAETEFTSRDPFFHENGYDKNNVSFDLGAQWRISSKLHYGIAVRNVNKPDRSLLNDGSDPLPREIQTGIVWKFGNNSLFGDVEYRDVKINGADFTPRVGIESKLFNNKLFLRGGFNRDAISAGFGLNIYKSVTSGSYAIPSSDGKIERVQDNRDLRFRLAYTVRYPLGGISNTLGTHFVGLNIFFDRQRKSSGPIRDITKDVRQPREMTVQRVDTVFVPQVQFVEIELFDSTKVKAYEIELLSLRDEISSLRQLNQAYAVLDEALKLYYQKQFNVAIEKCDNAIELVPSLTLAFIRKGSIFFAQRKYLEARSAWNMALRLDPKNAEVRAFLQQLEDFENRNRGR